MLSTTSSQPQGSLTPQQAVDRLQELHLAATEYVRRALQRFASGGAPPTPDERNQFRYPELKLVWEPRGPSPFTYRAWAKFQTPGVYTSTVTQPSFFRNYLLEQLRPLVEEYGATIAVGASNQEIPYPYVLEPAEELLGDGATAAQLAHHFPTPILSAVGDEIADGLIVEGEGRPRPLALFDAVRVDYSLRRLVHYTGSDWRVIQPWILLTNYHRYVDGFVRWALAELSTQHSAHDRLVLPGGGVVQRFSMRLSRVLI